MRFFILDHVRISFRQIKQNKLLSSIEQVSFQRVQGFKGSSETLKNYKDLKVLKMVHGVG